MRTNALFRYCHFDVVSLTWGVFVFPTVIDGKSTNSKVQHAGAEEGDNRFPFTIFLGVNIQANIGKAAKEPGEGANAISAATGDHSVKLYQAGDGKDKGRNCTSDLDNLF